jgi:D-alanyl-D-alanine carboxypeptidase/D-alanyl-D-alanine-endopeptidase (penicillin-binding protein 4)
LKGDNEYSKGAAQREVAKYDSERDAFPESVMISSIPRIRARRGNLCRATPLWIAAALLAVLPAAAQKSGPAKQQATAAHAKVRRDVAQFRARVEAILSEEHAQKAYWGVLVTDRDTGEKLYDLNADRFFTPASNAKMFTSAFALATLGSNYRFHTTLESKGALGTDGRLAGDLIFVGRGDPDLSNRKFPYAGKVELERPAEKVLADLADAAVARGLKEVDGDIVADDSYFPFDPYPADWTIGDLYFTFGAPVGAIALDDNSISVDIRPGEHEGDPAAITVEPGAAAENLERDVTTGPSAGKTELGVTRKPGSRSIFLFGSIPLGHAPEKLDLAMTEPAEVVARALKTLLEARGVRITGVIRVQHGPPAGTCESFDAPVLLKRCLPAPPSENLVLAEHVSLPLLESIRLTNKVSHDLHAEMLLRTVAREKAGAGLTDAGIWVEQDFLKTAGIADGDVVLSDGSGLANSDLVTPRSLVQLLRYAAEQPWGADFLSTLPIAGADGTLEDRMKGTVAAGLIRAKTGTLDHVRTLSGYATTVHGENLVFAIFGNNNPQHGRDATAAVDAIAVAMVETLGAPRPKKKK